jgi:hypothetical protein
LQERASICDNKSNYVVVNTASTMLAIYDESAKWLELEWVQEKLSTRWINLKQSNSNPFSLT